MADDQHPILDTETLQVPALRPARTSDRIAMLTILAHPHASRVGEIVRLKALGVAGGQVGVSRKEPGFSPLSGAARPLVSPFVSRRPVVLRAGQGGRVTIDVSGTSTAVRLDGAPVGVGGAVVEAAALDAGVVLELGTHVALLLHREALGDEAPPGFGMVGESEAARRVREAIARFAGDEAPVLVRGETGSGKELVAAALHAASPRRGEAYVTVNMAAIPATLAASELFGHARGAFSGATDRRDGFFVRADDGTLFLDEVGDTPDDVQAALLRVLETGEVQAVGARGPRRVDVRLVAATDADLEAAMASGRFRAPLFYRLAAREIRVPPLRERRADIGRLLVHFLGLELARSGAEARLEPPLTDPETWLPARLVARLARYEWPGNVRQLRNVAAWLAGERERAAVNPEDPELARLLPEPAGGPGAAPSSGPGTGPVDPARAAASAIRPPREIGDDELAAVLARVDYKLGAAAEALSISRPSLNDRIDQHPTLRRAEHLTAEEITAASARCGETGRPLYRELEVSKRGLARRMRQLSLS